MKYPLSILFEECAYKVEYLTTGKGTDYAFKADGRTLYIFFQGSGVMFTKEGNIDWVRNFLAFSWFKKPYKGMDKSFFVHVGFLNAWNEVKDLVINKITEKVTEEMIQHHHIFRHCKVGDYVWDRIIIVGYSHGAAIAAFCKECCWFYRPDIRSKTVGLAFESPRIYFGLWVKKSVKERWENFYVFRNKWDIVTHVPFKLMLFSHVGKIIKIGKRHCGFTGDHQPDNVLDALITFEESLQED